MNGCRAPMAKTRERVALNWLRVAAFSSFYFERWKADSGYDLHYGDGLRYQEHKCKLKNLHLNMLRPLQRPVLGTHNAHDCFKTAMLALRSSASSALRRIIPNKEGLYSPGLFFVNKMQRFFGIARS